MQSESAVAQVAPEQANGPAVECEGSKRLVVFLNLAREVDRSGVEVEVADVETAYLAGPEARIVQQRDDRLITIL